MRTRQPVGLTARFAVSFRPDSPGGMTCSSRSDTPLAAPGCSPKRRGWSRTAQRLEIELRRARRSARPHPGRTGRRTVLSGGMHRELSRADLSVNRQHRAAGRKHRADSLNPVSDVSCLRICLPTGSPAWECERTLTYRPHARFPPHKHPAVDGKEEVRVAIPSISRTNDHGAPVRGRLRAQSLIVFCRQSFVALTYASGSGILCRAAFVRLAGGCNREVHQSNRTKWCKWHWGNCANTSPGSVESSPCLSTYLPSNQLARQSSWR
jgi:hypothetical protein